MELYYIQINLLCILLLLIVNFTLSHSNILPVRRIAFGKLVTCTIILCLSDIAAWCSLEKTFPGASLLVQLSNMVYYGAITWVGYAWVKYVHLRINSLEENFKKRTILDMLPLVAMLIIIAVNPFTEILFTVDDAACYSRGDGIILHWIVSWGYLLYGTALVLIAILRADSKMERRVLLPLLVFIVPPVLAALLQMLFYGVTSMQCGLTASILIIALSYLSEEVSQDTLTGLNNRRALENYLMDQLQRGKIPVTVLMCDVDHFKHINDTLGHTAGDLVLKRMAASMKKVCGNYSRDVFLCRYGGDEFVICCFNMSNKETANLVSRVEQSIESLNHKYSDGLDFGISIGTAGSVCDNFRDVEGLIAVADAAMYEKKHADEI